MLYEPEAKALDSNCRTGFGIVIGYGLRQTRQFTLSFRPQRSGEPESSKSLAHNGLLPYRE
jgi:hypothetical protein